MNKVSIEARPAEVESRDEIGHWEIDTVIGKSHDGAVVTLVERTSRFTVIGKLVGKYAELCAEKTIEILTPFSDKVKSITADNGKEFAKFERIAETLEALFFFAHSYHSWERGTNENTNGLIRQYLPKSMGFEFITQENCQKIMDKLNNRPRKVLGFRTPAEVFFSNTLRLSHLKLEFTSLACLHTCTKSIEAILQHHARPAHPSRAFRQNRQTQDLIPL